jgi:hypothetical protein
VSSTAGCAVTTVSTDTDGQAITCTATSLGGTSSLTVTIKRDATAPSVTPTVTGTLGTNGWYTSDVHVAWTTAGGVSGIASPACAAQTLATDDASATYACTATSGAGLSTTQSVTVKRDATKPVLGFTGNAGTYLVDQTVAISCSASDAMSGIATSDCPIVSAAAYTFALGTNTLAASATDRAGNSAAATTSFVVRATAASVCSLTRAWVSQPGLPSAMCQMLDAAALATARNDMPGRETAVNGYESAVRAQIGKNVSAEHAEVLIRLARAL